MKILLIYLAGVATPFLFGVALLILGEISDWRARRRYQRAWDKFSAEFATITPMQLAACRVGPQPA